MRWLVALVKCAGTVGLFYIILQRIDTRDIVVRIAAIDLAPLAVVAAVLAGQQWVHAWRWREILVRVCGTTAPMRELLAFLGAGQLYGQLLPSSMGTDVVRGGMLSRRIGIGAASLSVLVDRLSGLLTLLLLMLALLPALYWRTGRLDVVTGLAVIGGVGLAAVTIGLVYRGSPGAGWLPASVSRITQALRDARGAVSKPATAGVIIGGGVVLQLASVALFYLLGRAISVPLRATDCLLIVPAALLLSAVPISFGGWGVREAAMASGFGLVGVATADAVAVSVLYGLTAPAIGLVYGVISLFARIR